jgi:hypothetical protein
LDQKEEKKAKPSKVGRRLSARVGDLFKSKPKAEAAHPAKIEEQPPKIEEPAPIAPLENPSDAPAAQPAATETAAATEEPKPAAPAAAPVVAATA